MKERQNPREGNGSRYSNRQIRFAEAGILFALLLAVAVVAGVKLIGGGEADHALAVAAAERAARTEMTTAAGGDATVAEADDGEAQAADTAEAQAAPAVRPDRPVSYEEAEGAYFDRRYAEAADLFAAYAGDHPANAWGHYMLGLSLWKAGEPEGAREALEQALAIRPDHLKSRLNLARVLLDLDRPADALAAAEQVTAADPDFPTARRVLANALQESGRTDEAIVAYEDALRRDPDDAWSLNNLGLLLLRRERFAEALPALARAVTLRPGEACFQNNLGSALERSGHLQAAQDAYAAAVEADGSHERARVSLERVEATAAVAPGEPVDLAALAASFELPAPAPVTVAIGAAPDAPQPEAEAETETETERVPAE